jgi:hypothetical protein
MARIFFMMSCQFDGVRIARKFFAVAILGLIASGTGCSREESKPVRTVTRRDAARFIIEARGESLATGCATPFFADVPCSDAGWGWIERLRTDGLTRGCDRPVPSFCPDEVVLRAQGAMFMARAAAGGEGSVPLTYGPDPATGRKYSCDPGKPDLHFKDVHAAEIYCQHVHYLWARGALASAGELYRPADKLTWDELNGFLVKDFKLKP